jgi:hypothetical protein
MSSPNSVSGAFKELLRQLGKKLTGGRAAGDGDELDRVTRELEAEAAASDGHALADDAGEAEDHGDRSDRSDHDDLGEPEDSAPPSRRGGSSSRRGGSRSVVSAAGDITIQSTDGGHVIRVGGSVVRVDGTIRSGDMHSGARPHVAEREVDIVVDEVEALDLEGWNGSLSVEAAEMADGRLEGVARIRCGGRDAREAQRRASEVEITCEVVDGCAVVRAVFPDASSHEVEGHDGVGFELAASALHGLRLGTSNGSVIARGFDGQCVVGTSNGSVEVTAHSGPITIETSNGSVEVEQCDDAAPVSVDSSNGAIAAAIRGTQSPMSLSTSNGRVDASIPVGWAGTVEASTSNAEARIETPREVFASDNGEQSVSFGNARPLARIDSSNGAIHVRVGFDG